MKADVLPDELPAVPRKRRALEQALDLYLALWLASDDLTPSERRRVAEEKARRKALSPDVHVGVIVGAEGFTPPQLAVVGEAFGAATHVHYCDGDDRFLRRLLRDGKVPTRTHMDWKLLVQSTTMLVAAPREPEKPNRVTGVWEAIRYAKHRKVPVRVVMPDGTERT